MDFLFHSFTGVLSVLLPTVASVVRFRKTERTFLPFLLLMPVGLLSELTSYVVVQNGYSNSLVINFYLLAEALLITWQFRRWGLFDRKPWLRHFYTLLQASYFLWWLFESFVLSNVLLVNSYFILFVSFSIVVMSVDALSEQIITKYYQLWRNAIFWICLGFILYFTCSFITETFWVYGLQLSASFRGKILTAMLCINLAANLIYVIAILWMPTKFRYLTQW